MQAKIPWKGSYLATSVAIGLVESFVATFFFTSSVRNTHASMLKNEVFPVWLNKERVINPDRVFFELDDNKLNEPTIWHSGLYLI